MPTITDQINQLLEANKAVPPALVKELMDYYHTIIRQLERRNNDDSEIERIVSESAGL